MNRFSFRKGSIDPNYSPANQINAQEEDLSISGNIGDIQYKKTIDLSSLSKVIRQGDEEEYDMSEIELAIS